MKKINITIVTLVFVAFVTIALSSCHRNTCPTFNKVEVEAPVRA